MLPRCLDDVEVLAYLERRLARGAMARVRSHLDLCLICLQLIVELAALEVRRRSRVRSSGDAPSPPA